MGKVTALAATVTPDDHGYATIEAGPAKGTIEFLKSLRISRPVHQFLERQETPGALPSLDRTASLAHGLKPLKHMTK